MKYINPWIFKIVFNPGGVKNVHKNTRIIFFLFSKKDEISSYENGALYVCFLFVAGMYEYVRHRKSSLTGV